MNLRKLPQKNLSNGELVDVALSLGCVEAKIIPTKNIMLGNWVKLQCQYGCSHFGKLFTCPPCTPNADDMSDILMDYQQALLIKASSAKDVHKIVLSLESRLKTQGEYKAFGLEALPCDLCEVCTVETQCQFPEEARPTLQACGIDVPQTVSGTGWDVATEHSPCSEAYPFGMVLIN